MCGRGRRELRRFKRRRGGIGEEHVHCAQTRHRERARGVCGHVEVHAVDAVPCDRAIARQTK